MPRGAQLGQNEVLEDEDQRAKAQNEPNLTGKSELLLRPGVSHKVLLNPYSTYAMAELNRLNSSDVVEFPKCVRS